jgi:hypothetical protein
MKTAARMDTWEQRWEGPDGGLRACWQAGQDLRDRRPDLAQAVKQGQLPELPWKGGVAPGLKARRKWGSPYYLAMWQGLRGDPLTATHETDVALTCSATGVTVTYTSDSTRWAGTA